MGRFFVIFFLISFSLGLHSQTDSVYYGEKPIEKKHKKQPSPMFDDWKNRITYGGNFQALLGNPTMIYLSPTIGYLFTKKFNAGLGFIYNYTSVNYGVYGKYSQSIYGAHSFARYFVTPSFYLQGQYDKLLQPNWASYYNPDKKIWVDYALVGLGYSQHAGDHVAFNTSLMYNLTPHRLSIYPSRFIIQIGFVIRP